MADGDASDERFLPERTYAQLVEIEQEARYRWAAHLCSRRRVLDAGCGEGRGAELLSRARAAEVVAVDPSEAAIDIARAAGARGVRYQVSDLAAMDLPDGSFDLAVCFGALERVEQPERVLDELARVLEPDGMLVLSTTCAGGSLPGIPRRRHELTSEDLRAELEGRFGSVRVVPQRVMLASVIGDGEEGGFETETGRAGRGAQREPADELYLVAIAGRELPADPAAVVSLGPLAGPRRWLEHAEEQRLALERQGRRLEELETLEAERRRALERLAQAELEATRAHEQLAAAGEEIGALRAQLYEAAAEVSRLSQSEAQLHALLSSRSWRLTAPLRRVAADTRRTG